MLVVLLALGSSICCWGPPLVLILGISSSMIPSRGLANIICIALALKVMCGITLLKLRHRKLGCCQTRVLKRTKFIYILALGFMLLPYVSSIDSISATEHQPHPDAISFYVPQVHCIGCVKKLEGLVQHHFPNANVEVDLSQKVLFINREPVLSTGEIRTLMSLVHEIGYDTKPLRVK